MSRVTLGSIVGVYGIRGWVRVHSFTRPAENLKQYRRWWVAGAAGEAYETQVRTIRAQGTQLVAEITDRRGEPLADRDAAAQLIGAELQVDRSELPKLPDGRWYWMDLVGLKVFSTSGALLGSVTGVVENGAQDVLQVADDVRERLIPFVKETIIRAVDLEQGRIIAEWEPDY